MVDQFTQVTHQGFFGRLKNSFMGVFVGILMIPISLGLLGWNEFRTVHRSRGLNEARSVVQTISDLNQIRTDLNDKLVCLSGLATTQETLTDKDFEISQVALRFRRHVEMYQWEEKKETTNRDKFGGGQETVTTYSYSKSWNEDEIDSRNFYEPSGHNNPAKAFASMATTAKVISVGAYELNDSLKSSITNWKKLDFVAATVLSKVSQEQRDRFVVKGQELFYSAVAANPNPDSPQVGDLRIRFEYCPDTDVSFVASLTGNSFSPYRTSNGEKIESLYLGKFTAEEIMDKLVSENNFIAWILRFVGFMLCTIGFNFVFAPLNSVASIIPMVGRFTGLLTFFAATLLAIVASSITIGIAWIAVRPVLGIGMLIIGSLAIYGLMRLRKNSRSNSQKAQSDDSDVEVIGH